MGHFTIISFVFCVLFISCGGCKGPKGMMGAESKVNDSSKAIISRDEKNKTQTEVNSTEFDLGILKDAPILPLEDADITEVYDHYILQDTANNRKYHFYDGNKQQAVDFSEPDVHIQVSRNQKYLTKMSLIQNKMSNQYFLDVELRDASNTIIAKQSIPSAYQDYYDEFRDEIIPLEDGSGFIQIGRRLGLSCFVTGYKLVGNKFIKKFQLDKPANFLYDIKSNDDGSKIALVYESDNENTEKYTLALYNMHKGLLWENPLPKKYHFAHQWDFNYTFLNNEDLYLFKGGETGKVLRYNFDGKIIDSINVLGNVQYWEFLDSEEGEVLLVYSKKNLFIYNPKSKSVKKIDLYTMLQLKGDAYISIRNAIFSRQLGSEGETLIFTILVDAHPKDILYFSGIAFYDLIKNTFEVFQSAPFYGQVSSKNGELFLQKQVTRYFYEKIPKIDLNKIK